jgi:hypothetical protein
MKTLIPFISLLIVLASCGMEEDNPTSISDASGEIMNEYMPLTTLSELSPGFKFSMPSEVYMGPQADFFKEPAYLVIINDENSYLRAVQSNQTLPTVDFSKYTLLAIAIESKGDVDLRVIKDADKTILKINQVYSKIGIQGLFPRFYTAIVPKVDSANVEMVINILKIH